MDFFYIWENQPVKRILFFVALSVFGFSYAQSETKSDLLQQDGILIGVHISDFPTVEIGYSKYFYSPENTKMPFAGGYGISVENYFLKDYIMAPKLFVWTNVIGLNFGGSIPWYSNLEGNNSLKVRLEIGVGAKNWRINLGYNIPIYNHGLHHIAQTMLSLNYSIPVTKPK